MASATFVLRKASLDDIAVIVSITREVVPLMIAVGNFQWSDDYPSEADFVRDVTAGNLWVGVAADNDKVLGYCAITEDQGSDYSAVWDIEIKAIVPHRLAVCPNARGKGIGKAFMEQAELIARERGMSWVRVDTNTKNEATNKLFPKLGFRYVGEISLTGPGKEGLRYNCFEKFCQ